MNCADLEIRYCDYLDGTLDAAGRLEVEAHLASCELCAAMARDISAAIGFMQQVPPVEAPPELMTRILFELPEAFKAKPEQPKGLRRLLHNWIQPILQPRFAMGFAMTILSFSLLARFVGISPRQLTLNDLRPANIVTAVEYKIHRAWERTVKFYENIRLVYEIQTQLREWTEGNAAAPEPSQPEWGAQPKVTPQQKAGGASASGLRTGEQEK
jgi:hypothetical protein